MRLVEPRSPAAVAHNISISVTDADTESPAGARRRIHLRSLSDVTPASRALAQRARSHSERPRASPAPTPSHALLPRAVRSARCSPSGSRERLDEPPASADRPRHRGRFRSDTVGVLGDPWRKMSEVDLRAGRSVTRATTDDSPRPFDPWVRKSAFRGGPDDSCGSREIASDANVNREAVAAAAARRGKLERKAAVGCEACGGEVCECRRGGGAPAAGGCTCERSPARLPRPPPAPLRALSAEETRPRRLYKSASQKVIYSSADGDEVKKVNPLLETTC